jgi:hypothetical protein
MLARIPLTLVHERVTVLEGEFQGWPHCRLTPSSQHRTGFWKCHLSASGQRHLLCLSPVFVTSSPFSPCHPGWALLGPGSFPLHPLMKHHSLTCLSMAASQILRCAQGTASMFCQSGWLGSEVCQCLVLLAGLLSFCFSLLGRNWLIGSTVRGAVTPETLKTRGLVGGRWVQPHLRGQMFAKYHLWALTQAASHHKPFGRPGALFPGACSINGDMGFWHFPSPCEFMLVMKQRQINST